MLNWINRNWQALILVALLFAVLDGVFSSLMTCHPDGNAAANQQSNPESCSIFRGPIIVSLFAVTNWLQGYGEAVTAAFTVILALSTIALWDATRTSARIAERALTELERPYLGLEVTSLGFALAANGTVTSPISDFKYQFVNYGRTVARLTELVETWSIVDRVNDGPRFRSILPSPIDASMRRGQQLPYGVVVSTGKPYEFRANSIAVIDVQRFAPRPGLYSIGNDLYFLGYVRYVDIFNNRFIMGFCAIYDFISGRFILMGDERYNYIHQET